MQLLGEPILRMTTYSSQQQNRNLPNMIWTGRVKGFDSVDRHGAHWRIGPAVTHDAAMSTLATGRAARLRRLARSGGERN